MRLSLVLLALVLLAPSLAAQETNPFALEPGDRIRLRAPLPHDPRVPARVITVGPVYFGYSVDGREDLVYTRAFETVDTIDVRLSSRRYSARSGALWGAYLGAAAGAITGPFVAPSLKLDTGPATALFSGSGSLVGALAGAALGAVLAPSRWYRYVQ
ncbi:MAG: hypothetical protein WD766_11700 [Gemmatimonadota bacterium]